MIIDSGRSPGRDTAAARSRRAAVARLRGGSAGSVSGALAIAAHGWASGGMPLPSSTLALLVAVCTVVGALVSRVGPLRTGAAGLVVALAGGQVLGHISMSFGMTQMHHAHSMWTPAMLGAHIAGAICAAIVILGAEAAFRITTTAFARLVPGLLRSPAVADRPAPRITHRDRVIHRIFPAEIFRTRGPPALVRV